MIAPDKKIRELMENGSFSVSPLGPESIQPASLDCTLDNHFLTIAVGLGPLGNLSIIELDDDVRYEPFVGDQYILGPKEFVLATTKEYFRFGNNVTAFVEGRSSIGRLGLFVENAGWIDPGFEGQITLELYNASARPIRLRAGRRICQLVICELPEGAEKPYSGKYQGQKGAVGTRISQDREVAEDGADNERISDDDKEALKAALHDIYFNKKDAWNIVGRFLPSLVALADADEEKARKQIFKRLCGLAPDQYGYHL